MITPKRSRGNTTDRQSAMAHGRPTGRTWEANDLEAQLRSLLEAIEAVRRGDLTRRLRKERYDIFGEIADSYNGMMDSLLSVTSEVTRVAREVGTEGKLGGQAHVPGVAGTWKELTDNVNAMALNLTGQVRNISQVSTAVANGDLTQKIVIDAKGEILQLKETINKMVENLRAFSGEVTRIAREVGTEGKLGGQAQVPGVTGTWKELADNVNAMAANSPARSGTFPRWRRAWPTGTSLRRSRSRPKARFSSSRTP